MQHDTPSSQVASSVIEFRCTRAGKASQVEGAVCQTEANNTKIEMENFWMYQAEYRKKNVSRCS